MTSPLGLLRVFILLIFFIRVDCSANEGKPDDFHGLTPVGWSEKIAASEMKRLGDPIHWAESGRRGKWDYASALLALSLVRLGECTGNPSYTEYGELVVSTHIDADGKIRGFVPSDSSLDSIFPGNVLLSAIDRGESRPSWTKAVESLRVQLDIQPRTDDGGFWHKNRYPSQMWLDGIYMASPFLAHYASTFKVPSLADEASRQIMIMDHHGYDPDSGLFRHAWDEKHVQPWADPKSGCSLNFWSRAIGWYAMAIVDTLDYLPADHPERGKLLEIFRRVVDGLVKWQDPSTGVWWQVTDAGGRTGNYLEASGSSMFVYALAKGMNKGYLPREKYLQPAMRGYRGIIDNFVREKNGGDVSLAQICEVAGLGYTNSLGRSRDGSFDYYVSEPVVENDPKGVGPFIMAGIEVQKLLGVPDPGHLTVSSSHPLSLPKVVLVGDSTVTDAIGWGAGFGKYLCGKVDCVNTAINGRSSKSFRAEGHWEPALGLKGDYYLIQFGHNDQPGKGPDRETDPWTTYYQNMERYIDDVRAIGGIPILVTSLTRRDFDKSGNGKIVSTLTPYVQAIRNLAAVKKVPLIDLNALSTAYCEKIGPNESARFNPKTPQKKEGGNIAARPTTSPKPDTTHLTEEGGRIFGQMVAVEFLRLFPSLKKEASSMQSVPPGNSNAVTTNDSTLLRDISYGEADGEKLLLDAHVPEGKGPFPIAILIHGGGWSGGDKGGTLKPGSSADITPWFAPLSKADFTWFSINYRLAPKHRWPACLNDVQTAIRWVKVHASEYKGDPKRIVLIGHSAGGQLACLSGMLANNETSVQAVIGFAPVTNHEQDLTQRGGLSSSLQNLLNRPKNVTPESLALLRDISPINHVRAGLPPYLLIHGDADVTVPIQQSRDFQQKLNASGNDCDLIVIPGGVHALADWSKCLPDYQARMIAWLKRILAGVQVSAPWIPDLSNGTYKNPVIYADYSDPDAIRVGNDYWLTSSSFSHLPGLPILHSTDLVNWELVSHALPRLSPEATYGVAQPGNGVFAPSIRFHEGKYFIYYPDPDFGIYVTTAKNPTGPWSDPVLVKAGKGLIDPCPFWDDDGKVYLIHAWAKSRSGFNNRLNLIRLNEAGTSSTDDLGVLINGDELEGFKVLEGPKFYKRNGWYYVFAPAGGVKTGWQSVFRSKSIFGPYEQRIVMDQGKTTVNGPHQGALVDTPAGDWWFLHFQDQEAYGRVVHLEPVLWQNDWPLIGEDQGNGRGQPVITHAKPANLPATILSPDPKSGSPELGFEWQWQANPSTEWYSLNEGNCFLRLNATSAVHGNLWLAPYLLLQKFTAPRFAAETCLELSSVSRGERAGLVVFGSDYAMIAVTRTDEGYRLVSSQCLDADKGNKEVETSPIPLSSGKVFLRVDVTEGAHCGFSFSEDGKVFKNLGAEFVAKPGRWVGAKVGLFCESPDRDSKGHADISFFRIRPILTQESLKTDSSHPELTR